MGNIKNSLRGTGTIVLASFLALSLIACTRTDDVGSSSNLSISLPKSMSSQKSSAQAFDVLRHLVINVTGDGISQPILFTWDANRGNTLIAAPGSFELTVPQGANRLVQVLAVYSDSTSSSMGSMQFFYGDTQQTISSSSTTLAITVSSIGKGAPITSGHVAGRYLTTTDSGPTGSIDIMYSPDGKPSMIVERSLIMNGWFQVFGLIGAKFNYRLPNGELMFGGAPVELTDAYFPASSKQLKVSAPLRQRSNGGGGSPQWSLEDSDVYIYGFYGPGSAGKAVCASTSPALTRVAKSNDTATMLTVSLSAPPANLSQAGLPSIYLQGGVAAGTPGTLCVDAATMTSNLFTNIMSFVPTMIENGNDNSAGFRLPFVVSSTGTMVTVTSPDSSTKTVSGVLLPGASSVIEQFMMYKKVSADEFNNSESISCQSLVPELGFTSLGVSPVSGTSWSATLPITQAEASSGVTVVLCPMKGGNMLSQGTWLKKWTFTNYSVGSTATKLAVIMDNVGQNTTYCSRLLVQPQDASNNPATVGPGTSVTLSATGGTTFYADPVDCYAGTNSSAVQSLGASGSYIYFKNASTTAETITATAGALSGASSFTYGTAGTMTTVAWLFDMRYSRKIHECIPIFVQALQGGPSNSYFPAGSYNFLTSGSGTLYKDASCNKTGVSALANLPTFGGMFPLYYRATVPESNITFSSTGTAAATSGVFSIQDIPNGPATQLVAEVDPHFSTNITTGTYCEPVSFVYKDADGWPSKSQAGQNVTVTLSGGASCTTGTTVIGLDSSSGCGAPVQGSTGVTVAVGAGESRVTVWVKKVSGSVSCTITGTGAFTGSTSIGF